MLLLHRYQYALKRKNVRLPSLIKSMKDKLFDISAEKLTFRCREDEVFFEDQRTSRKFTIGCIDHKDNIKINHNIERKARDTKKSEPCKQWKNKFEMPAESPEKELPDNSSLDTTDSIWTPSVSSRQEYRRKSNEVTITLNKRKWMNTVSAIADKTLTSDRAAVQLVVASVSSSEHAKDLNFSFSTMRRKRQKVRTAIADVVKEGVAQELQDGHKYILHWDEKLLKGRRRVDGSKEYMAVVLSNVVTGNHEILVE